MRTNVHDLLGESAARHGSRTALSFKDVSLTYEQVWAASRAVGAGLQRLGVSRAERVAVFLDKRIETVTSIFGTSSAGAVFVPVNPLLKPPQVGYLLQDCDVTTLITTAQRLEIVRAELKDCPALRSVILVPDAAAGATAGATSDVGEPAVHLWADVFGEPAEPESAGVIDVDMAAILYTSGSTGKPKGVVLSHRNLIAGAESVSDYLANGPDDVILAALPLSFDAGLSQLTTAFSAGAHLILMNYLLPADVVRLCARHGVTGLTCVPPLWVQIAELGWSAEAAGRLRYFANTGGRMPKALLDRLRAIFPQASPFLMYGLTEAFRSTYLDPAQVDTRPDSIGKAIPNAEILVLRPDGTPCEPGEEGELVHRGALVAQGYWDDPERTGERFRPVPGGEDSWRVPEVAVWSGDAVVRDEEGFLYFVGRKDDMIKTSGYRVSPTEVEEVAYTTGLVRDAVALGVPDERLGQRVALVAAPEDPATFRADDLLVAMRRLLPLFMVPAEVHRVSEIPRSPNGKFDRALLKKEYGA